jgi:hypothetical protein
VRFTVKLDRLHLGAAVALLTLASVASVTKASAESAFITQAGKGSSYTGRSYTPTTAPTIQAPTAGYTAPKSTMTPEAMSVGGNNLATTLQMGQYNKVFQGQFGTGNVSNVGIIAGVANNVGVLQAGDNLRSNLALINTQGLNVGVIQPNGSAPVNMLIARLPNGALLIKR